MGLSPFTVSDPSPIVRIMKRLVVLVSGIVAALGVPAVALAAVNPSSSISEGTNAQNAVASGEAASGGGGVLAAGNGAGGTLPFTGMNLVLILAIGLALVVTGVLLRRRTQRGS